VRIAKKGCFLSLEWEKTNFTTFGTPRNPPLEKILPTPMPCISKQDLQHILHRFSAACDQAETQISTKQRGNTSPQKTSQCTLQVRGNALQSAARGEVQVPWGGIHDSGVTEGRTRRLIDRLVKQTQVCVSFIGLWSQNGRFQTPQSCQFLHRFLFRSSPTTTNLV